jgi:hypothetical protein
LIKLQELWENTDNYNQQDIKSYLDKRIEDYLLKHKKTTYLGLYLPLQQMSLDENGNIVYPPIVEDTNYQSGNEDKLFTNAILNNPISDEDSYDQIFTINGDSVAINNSYGEDSEYFDHSDWRRISFSDYNGFIREENPELMNICSKWSNEDLSLKMYLVGNFFETYFMPIHLDLIHSTIENVVFTNTIKIIQESRINRTDYINNFFTFKCNVNDNDIFFLEDISARVNKDTIAGTQWNENIKYYEPQYKDGIKHYNNAMYILGVDDNIDRIADDNDLKTFLSQYYNGIGKVVNFICDVDIQADDFIRQLNISLTRENEVVSNKFKLLSQKNQSKNIKFNILCKQEGDYKINIEFITANQFNYVKTIHFSVLDNTSKNIKVCKVKYNTLSEHEDSNRYQTVSNYMFSHHRNYGKNTPMRFFIPEYLQNVDTSKLDGVCMNRTIIVEGDISIENVIAEAESNIRDNTKVLKRRNIQTQEVSYTIFILPVDTPADFQPIVDKKLLVRNDLVFYPENHHLEEIATSDNVTIDDYTFTQKDVLMVISNSKYLKYIEDPEWEFENVSRKNKSKPITLKSIQTPFIANVNYKLLDPGFYNVKFRYKLGQSIQEVSLDSAFRIV